MIQTQTFELKHCEDEIAVIAMALDLIGQKNYSEAASVLIARHDALMRTPELKLYDQRAA